jgi:hypothetical protein
MGWAIGNSFVKGGKFLGAIFYPSEGSKIRFWDDIWCGDIALKEAFPGLFIISANKASIADNVERSNGTLQWNIQFSQLVHDWEVEIVASFYRCLYSSKLRGVGEDKLLWMPSRKGSFEVKSFYRVLSSFGSNSFPWKGIWRSKAPPRVAFFAWTSVRGKILTLDNLRRRGMMVLTNVGYASWMGSRLIIFFSIVGRRVLCGMPFLPSLVYVGLCLAQSMRFLLAGGRLVVQGVMLFEKWFLFELCGAFGGNAKIDVLRTPRGLVRSSSIFFCLLFSPG